MRTEEYKRIEELLERFFEGRTSNEEERILYDFFAQDDVPPQWEPYREVFGYFGKGIVEEFREVPELRASVRTLSANRRKIGWILALTVAASLALILVNRFSVVGEDQRFNPYEGSYIVRNGERITDLNRIQPELEAIYLKAEAEQKKADRMLLEVEKLECMSRLADQTMKERYRSLLNGIPDDRTRAEVDSMLREWK